MSLCCSRSPIHPASSDDGSLLVAADARTERIGAKPSRAVVARGLRHTVLTHEDSAVFGTQQEAKKNSLVTITSTAFSSTPCPVRLLLCQSDPERLPARSGRSVPVFSRGPHTGNSRSGGSQPLHAVCHSVSPQGGGVIQCERATISPNTFSKSGSGRYRRSAWL